MRAAQEYKAELRFYEREIKGHPLVSRHSAPLNDDWRANQAAPEENSPYQPVEEKAKWWPQPQLSIRASGKWYSSNKTQPSLSTSASNGLDPSTSKSPSLNRSQSSESQGAIIKEADKPTQYAAAEPKGHAAVNREKDSDHHGP